MTPPFTQEHQLTDKLDNYSPSPDNAARAVPGCPRILTPNIRTVLELLYREFSSRDLDRIAPKLWWMSKQDSSSISPLHRQRVKRRTVIITEDPKLHLVWIHDRIFVKPLPLYISSFSFWHFHLEDEAAGHSGPQKPSVPELSPVRKAILGYLRTYNYLIQHESDFREAQELHLIPTNITWEQFCNFASDLARITDAEVSKRYQHGEIRLTRLNFYAPLLLHRSYFQRVEYQYGTYFARFYAPVLFSIGVMSIILSGLQLALAAEREGRARNPLPAIAFWVGVAIVACFSAVFICLCTLWAYKVFKEWKFAIRDRLRLQEEGRTKVA